MHLDWRLRAGRCSTHCKATLQEVLAGHTLSDRVARRFRQLPVRSRCTAIATYLEPNLASSSAVRADPQVEPPLAAVVVCILYPQRPDRRVHPDARAEAVAAARLPARPRRVAQY